MHYGASRKGGAQGGLAGSESVDFRGIAGSGSEMQAGLALLLRVPPTPILALALSLALRLSGSEPGSEIAWL